MTCHESPLRIVIFVVGVALGWYVLPAVVSLPHPSLASQEGEDNAARPPRHPLRACFARSRPLTLSEGDGTTSPPVLVDSGLRRNDSSCYGQNYRGHPFVFPLREGEFIGLFVAAAPPRSGRLTHLPAQSPIPFWRG